MNTQNFKIVLDALTYVAIFYGGYWTCYKAVQDYFKTRIAEADKKSQGALIEFILKEIKTLKDFQTKGEYNERVMRVLVEKVIDDLRFLMEQLFANAIPKRNIKNPDNE